jgi:peptidoglycan/xylan/chitin deacetylase (PgdA/CDA1 family)
VRTTILTCLAFGAAVLAGAVPEAVASSACPPGQGLGVARIVKVDTASGPLYGDITKYPRQANFLQPKEVVLTFDDGPMPWITRSILDTLDRYCTKATFFSVGRMAIAYPETLREVMARGHTLGTHTWSHPLNLRAQPIDRSVAEIERGFAAVAAAAGQPIAPFFRFPGLSDSGPMLSHLQSRGVATFTVDVVSNDSFIPSVERLTRETLAKVENRQGGIMLFHDIKAVTAKALPGILDALVARGYKVVHTVAKTPFQPDSRYTAEFAARIAALEQPKTGKPLNFFAAMPMAQVAAKTGAPVVALEPVAMSFAGASGAAARAAVRASSDRASARPAPQPAASGWSTTVKKSRQLRSDAGTPGGSEDR